MFERRWTYSNSHGLTKWYGHVDYFGKYVIGQWFALDAETGTEYWSRKFFRPNTICGCDHDVIVASETRSDGPWTLDFGIYGIDAQTGDIRWTNHGRGLWGKFLRCLDCVPGFTNEFRDVPKCVVDGIVYTGSGRSIDVRTGKQSALDQQIAIPSGNDRSASEFKLYDDKSLGIDGDTICIQDSGDDFTILRRDQDGGEVWRFAAKDRSLHVDGNFYSYRLHDGHIFIVLGDAPNYVPIRESEPLYVKLNPANYQLGVLNLESGECRLYPLANAQKRTECRIEAVRNHRILVSCDGTYLSLYAIT